MLILLLWLILILVLWLMLILLLIVLFDEAVDVFVSGVVVDLEADHI